MPEKDTIREERITYEIIVDYYNEVEVAIGWYYYLQANLVFPFDARLLEPIHSSLSRDKSNVRVISLAEEDECEDAIWAAVESVDGEFDIPLEHIQRKRPRNDHLAMKLWGGMFSGWNHLNLRFAQMLRNGMDVAVVF